MKKLTLKNLRYCVISLTRNLEWMEELQAYLMSSDPATKKKVSYFLNKTQYGNDLLRDFKENKDGIQYNMDILKKQTKHHWKMYKDVEVKNTPIIEKYH